jgi:hypothetical protein
MLRRSLLAWVLAASFSAAGAASFGQDAAPDPDAAPPDPVGPSFRGEAIVAPTATLTFKFENAALQPARFVITLHGDGTGHFVSEKGNAPPTDIADLPPEGLERDIVVSEKARESIFVVAHKEHAFAIKCENGSKKIAYQGMKTLSYDGPDAHGSCSFNYSGDPKMEWLTTEMMGIASTLEEGRRLAVEHAHGKLILDGELETLTKMVHDGDATELENIAPVLQAIITDESVILHTRRLAQALLDSAPLIPPAPK